jgi:hypothetical protein
MSETGIAPIDSDDRVEVLPADPRDVVLTVLPAPANLPIAERVDPSESGPPTRRFTRVVQTILGFPEWLFGLVSLFLGLAILAALPIVQFLSLGYLLEAGGRVARTGRFRDGFIGVRRAARWGGTALGIWLCLLPARLVSDLAHSAQIIDPGSRVAAAWRFALLVLLALTFTHIILACARGGKLRYFFWPFNFLAVFRSLRRGGFYARSRDAFWKALTSLRLPYYFSLGWRGFVVALAWLVIPVTLLALGRLNRPVTDFIAFLGAMLLAWVLMYLPFLQLRFAQKQRFRAGLEWRAVRREFRKAPWAHAVAYLATLAFALPLFLLKIEMVPREAAWLPSLFFVAFIYPARLLTGWALGRAQRRGDRPRHWFFRWTGRLVFIPAALFYVLIVFFTQYTSWNGVWSLYEQHAFLVPVPFLGL